MLMTHILGWTYAQWAEAAAYYKRFAPLPSPSVSGARAIKRRWVTNRADMPGGHKLVEVAREMEWSWAEQMMSSPEWL